MTEVLTQQAAPSHTPGPALDRASNGPPMITSDQIGRRVRRLGRQISKTYAEIDTPLVMVVILKGATVFAADLLRSLSIPAELEFVRASSYPTGTSSSGRLKLAHMVEGPLVGRHVLLVEDIIDSGVTVNAVRRRIQRLGAATVRLEAVLSGLRAGPITAVAIVCAMRQHEVEDNVALARIAGSFAGRGVVGFDLAGDEARYPAARQRPAFEAARAAGLRLTCHAGEAGEPASVDEALRLGVERIAHGVIGARSRAIVDRIRSEGVVLDVAPSANWKCRAVPSLAEHPLPRLLRGGVRCTISTDSRSVARTTLSDEFEICAAEMGMSDDELLRCNLTAYDAAF